MKKFLSFLVFVSFCFSTKAQLFNQDFNASTALSQYVSSSPNSGQFEAISPDGASLATTISNGVLRFNRTGAAGIYAYRNFTLSTNPTFVQLKFDFEGSNFQSGTQTPVFSIFVGNAFTSTSSGSTSNFASRIGVIAQPTAGEFKIGTIDNIDGAPSSGAFTGKQTITFIINNSGEDKSYTAPDGSVETVANGKMDAWVGLTKGINEFSLKNTDAKGVISGFKIQATSASGNGIFDFDNIEFKELSGITPPPPTDLTLPNTPSEYLTLKHPFIWASYTERQHIVDNINQYEWAKSLFNQLKTRVDAKKNAHVTNPEAVLKTIPAIPGVYADRTDHTDIVGNMTEAAILYYLTNDASYAKYAADILSHYMKYLAVQPVQKYQEGDDGLMFDDGWLESRTLFPRIALTYDFLYNYINNSSNKVYDLETKLNKQFNDTAAQTTVTNLADIVFMSIRARYSNHSVLAGNGALFNLLMISDNTKRDQYFNRFYNNTNETFDAYTWSLNNFSVNGVWPETFSYGKGSHELIIQSLNVIDRYNPSLNIISNNLKILDGFIGYANLFYPSNELMHFGDSGIEDDMTEGYSWILKIATRKNLPNYKQFAKQNLKYYYNQKGGYNPEIETDRLEFNSPLQLLWGENVEDTQTAVTPKTESTYNLVHAGIVVQRNFNTDDVKNNGLMYYSGGAAYVHTHSTGIDLELYGKGQVNGAESGSSTYGTDEHENYRVRHAAHNTVIVNGSGKRGGSNWLTKVANAELVASEPKSFGTPIATNFSFSTQFMDDSFNDSMQQRTNSIIRTSASTGYYFDILRSKGKSSNNYHDYIYHNVGDGVALKFEDNSTIPLSSSTKYATEVAGNVTGWTFFENVSSSASTNKGVNATFNLNAVNKFMKVSIPSGVNREYTTAFAPYTKGALNGYDKKKTPVITMRKYGEAWNEPFLAIYEPSDNQTGSVKSATTIVENGKIVGAKVISEVNGQEISDIILSNDADNTVLNLNELKIAFTGRFAIVRIKVKNGTTAVSLYIGKGQKLTFNGKDLIADNEGKAYLEYSLDYAFEFPIDAPIFTVKSVGETCVNKGNGSIVIQADKTNTYSATINNKAINFSNTTTIENLIPGNYELCISIDGKSFKQCYQVTIESGTSLSGKVSVANKMADISIEEGSAPFTVIKNGEAVLETYQNNFSLKVEHGDNLQIISKSACQGVLSKRIELQEKVYAYPNPSNGLFEVVVSNNLNSVIVEIYNTQSQLISSKTYVVTNGVIQLDLRNNPIGVYFLKVNTNKPAFVKVVKK